MYAVVSALFLLFLLMITNTSTREAYGCTCGKRVRLVWAGQPDQGDEMLQDRHAQLYYTDIKFWD
jgi:hypothetical protein